MRYSITLSYDGSSFFGWQVQPGAISVQECLEKALSTLLKEDISVTGAGRTLDTTSQHRVRGALPLPPTRLKSPSKPRF